MFSTPIIYVYNQKSKIQTFGDFTKSKEPAFFTYTEEVFDLNEDGIDPAIFTVPAGCPQ